MYPQGELTRLAAHKAAVRWDIARRRAQCAGALGRVAQPLDWLDRMLALWRRFSPLTPFVVLPLGLILRRTVFPRLKILRSLVRWGPLIFSAARGISSALRTHPASTKLSRTSSI